MSRPGPKAGDRATAPTPDPAAVDVIPVDPLDAAAFGPCRDLRTEVFVDEQGVPYDLEHDGLDDSCLQLAARDRATGALLGTARLRIVVPASTGAPGEPIPATAKAERVAVRRSARGRGVGRALMVALEDAARTKGHRVLRLAAQEAAIPFYEALGYRPEGEPFLEAGIVHRRMDKALIRGC